MALRKFALGVEGELAQGRLLRRVRQWVFGILALEKAVDPQL